jgi:hypothetical protein
MFNFKYMTRGETLALNHQPEVAPGLDNTEKIELAYKKGSKVDKKKDELDFGELGTTHYAGKVKEMNQRLEQIRKKRENEKMTKQVKDAIREMDAVKKEEIIDGVAIDETPPPLPKIEPIGRPATTADEIEFDPIRQAIKPEHKIGMTDPRDFRVAELEKTTPQPSSFFGKMWRKIRGFSGDQDVKDIDDSRKLEADLKKQERGGVTKDTLEKWGQAATKEFNKPATSPEMEAAQIQSSAYNARKTAEEKAQIEHDSVKMDAKITDPKVLEKIRQRATKEKAQSDKMVADYEAKFQQRKKVDFSDLAPTREQEAELRGMAKPKPSFKELNEMLNINETAVEDEDWQLPEDSELNPKNLEKKTPEPAVKKHAVDTGYNKAVEKIAIKRAGKIPELSEHLEHKDTGVKLEELRKEAAGAEWGFLGLTRPKFDADGNITNLPGGDRTMLIADLDKRIAKAESKKDFAKLNKLERWKEVLNEYLDMIGERTQKKENWEKFLKES